MAIRGPRTPQDVPAPTARTLREQPASPLQRLVDFGAARTPQEAKKVLTELLATLRAAGFPVSATGSAEGQLGQALKLFQKEQGLPQSGVLDKQTRDALVDAGLMPKPSSSDGANEAGAAKQTATEAPARFDLGGRKLLGGELGLPKGSADVPEGAKSGRAVELEQAVDKSTREKPPEVDLKSFLSSMRAAGFAGAGKGAEQMKDALKKLQKAEGLPQTGTLDGKTADALVRRGVLDERVLQSFPSSTSAQPQQDSRAQTPDARSDPTTRGANDPGDPQATRGRGDVDGAGAGQDGVGGQASSSKANGTGTSTLAEGTGDVVDPWSQGQDGNAPAGDDDVDDERRGHANADDGIERPEDFWKVPALAAQIEAGLAAILRDDDGKGAATYAWDFTLLRPGVYGAKQPAQRLFHLVVTQASAFDPLWERARAALNEKLLVLEPEAALLERDDFERALKRARYRT